MSDLQNRYDFVLFFDVKDGNPNGDPDAGNIPRVDPETGQGLVTDVCLKRKLRNFVFLAKHGTSGYDIFVKERMILNDAIDAAYAASEIQQDGDDGGKAKSSKKRDQGKDSQRDRTRREMCRRYYDVRAFGAVLSTGEINKAGQVRGPVQLTFARSVDPVATMEHSITRMAVTSAAEAEKQGGDNRTMGRKSTIPYGLYRTHGFVSPALAQQTGFSSEDLDLLWSGIENMFEHDRSAARGLMAVRWLVIFKHSTVLGDAAAHRLFEAVSARRRDASRPSREFTDYELAIDRSHVPSTVEILERGA